MIAPLITAEELEKLKDLPQHVPGVVVTVQLADLPDYLAVHGLIVAEMKDGGLLIVKQEEAQN